MTGGTITAVGAHRVDPLYGETGRSLNVQQLVDGLPELRDVAEPVPYPFASTRSSHELTFSDWIALRDGALAAVRDGLDGVVITHGTNTLEETAYFLELTTAEKTPIVVTGAMRPATSLSSDGDINLLDAFRVATSAASRDRGVLVVLDGTIHRARDVAKMSTYALGAFQSPRSGPLGRVFADGTVVYHSGPDAPTRDAPFDVGGRAALPRVDVVVSYLGSDGAMIDAAVAAGAAGIVHVGTGGGRATPMEDEALRRAIARGVVVCRTARAAVGRVMPSPSLASAGFVSAGELDPWKSRILLALALTRTQERREIQALFDSA